MKNLKLLLLSLITPLFLGVSFGVDQIFNDSYVVYSGSLTSSFTVLSDFVFTPGQSFCLKIDNIEDNYLFINQVGYCGSSNCSSASTILGYFGNGRAGIDYPLCFSNTIQSKSYLTIKTSGYSTITPIYKLYLLTKSDTSFDCSSVETQLNQCQSDLASCQNDGSHCDTLYGKCVEDYSGCQSDLSSLENYNQSLTDQLNECLNNSTASGDDANSGNCLTNSLFWFNNDNMLSLPITNNLFLPNGYQGYVNSGGVLGISDIENNTVVYEFDQESKENTINSMSIIMLFLLATGFIMFVIKFLKKLFFKS